MRMTVYKLVAQKINDTFDVVIAVFFKNLGIKHDMQQDIAEFLGHILHLSRIDGVAQLVNFLYRIGTQRSHGLLPVPGTFGPEPVHYVKKPAESLFLPFSVYFHISQIIKSLLNRRKIIKKFLLLQDASGCGTGIDNITI